jgi:hypothetical protein
MMRIPSGNVMIWSLLLLTSLVAAAKPGGPGPREANTTLSAVDTQPVWARDLQQSAFAVGEELKYDVKYGPIKAGEARLAITDSLECLNRTCYRAVNELKTTGFFSRFFKVNDRIESYLDHEGIFPWKIKKRLREGHYKQDRLTILDHRQGLAYSENDSVAIPPFTQDMLSIIYFIRTQDLDRNRPIPTESISNVKLYPVDIVTLGRETITVPAGTFDCYIITPRYQEGFEEKPRGELYLWLSNDSQRLPVKMKTTLEFGSIDMRLTRATGLTSGRVLP